MVEFRLWLRGYSLVMHLKIFTQNDRKTVSRKKASGAMWLDFFLIRGMPLQGFGELTGVREALLELTNLGTKRENKHNEVVLV